MIVEETLELFRKKLREIELMRREVWDECTISFLGDDSEMMETQEMRVKYLSALSSFATNALLIFRLRTLSAEEALESRHISREDIERAVRGMLIFIGREDALSRIDGTYIFVPQPFEEDTERFFSMAFAQYEYHLYHHVANEAHA